MNGRFTAIGVVCLCTVVAMAFNGSGRKSTADDKPDDATQTERDRWMAVKLASAQQILEHLTSGDFEELATSARRMQVMNFLEKWQRDEEFERESDYQGQLNAFEFATKELIRHAADENMAGTLQSYLAMTESCVRCHELIRDVTDD